MTRKPIWTEGLLVSQHHFQRQDRVLRRPAARSHPGRQPLRLGHQRAQARRARLRERAVSPAALQRHLARRRQRRVAAKAPACPRPSRVIYRPTHSASRCSSALASGSDSAQVSLDGSGMRRYTRELATAVDTNTGTSPQEVEWARPNLRILFGNERRDGFVTLRVAELIRQENGQFVVIDTRVASVLKLSAAPFLETGMRRVLANIVARQQQLFGERKGRQNAGAEFHATEIRKFLLLQALSAVIPELNHLLDTARVHPEEAYLVLGASGGHAGLLLGRDGADRAAQVQLPRARRDLRERCSPSSCGLVSGGTERAYTEIALEHRPDGMFIGRIVDPKLHGHEFFIAVKANMAEALVRERAPARAEAGGLDVTSTTWSSTRARA